MLSHTSSVPVLQVPVLQVGKDPVAAYLTIDSSAYSTVHAWNSAGDSGHHKV